MPSGLTISLTGGKAMSSISGAAGHAALAICESMLLSLIENKVIDRTEARAILADAAAAHRHAIPLVTDGGSVTHEEAAALIETMLKGGNSVRHA
jgi:DNA-binding IclR family transcriptional regulator